MGPTANPQLCCAECFREEWLAHYVRNIGKQGDCAFCGAARAKCVAPSALGSLFDPFLDLYEAVSIGEDTALDTEAPLSTHLWDRLGADWQVFSPRVAGRERELVLAILSAPTDEDHLPQVLKRPVKRRFTDQVEDELAGGIGSLWDKFKEELKHINRFFPLHRVDEEELGELLRPLQTKFPRGTTFFRSRRCDGTVIPPEEMGTPPPDKAYNGRANPVGIPYLYLASTPDTAVSETRPAANGFVTVAEFALKKDLHVIDLRRISPFQFSGEEDFVERVSRIGYLQKLGDELSEPVSEKDAHLDYLPSQYLCEFIKTQDFDGVVYRSSVADDGFNVALFGESGVTCTSSRLLRISKATYETEEVDPSG